MPGLAEILIKTRQDNEAVIHKRVFTLFGNITRLADTSIENQ